MTEKQLIEFKKWLEDQISSNAHIPMPIGYVIALEYVLDKLNSYNHEQTKIQSLG